eukprot:jgi/Psemu1/4772/gm1.4772_g
MALGYFEEVLERSGSGFLIPTGLTYVDLGLFYILFELAEEDNVPDFTEAFNLPKLGITYNHRDACLGIEEMPMDRVCTILMSRGKACHVNTAGANEPKCVGFLCYTSVIYSDSNNEQGELYFGF